MVDLFSGSGALTKEFRKQGWTTSASDLKNGETFDVLKRHNLTRLLGEIGCSRRVHIATPCSSFSQARKGRPGAAGGPLRSTSSPHGLAGFPDRYYSMVGCTGFHSCLSIFKFSDALLDVLLSPHTGFRLSRLPNRVVICYGSTWLLNEWW